MVAERTLSLRDMTGAAGCTARTVRYYERQGLLRAARSAGGHRLFDAGELERLQFIVALREAGWPLDDIVALLEARSQAGSDREASEHLRAVLQAQIDRLAEKLSLLTALRRDLESTRTVLAVCQACTAERERQPVECSTCDRLPERPQLPRGFRLAWRGRESSAPVFDEPATTD